METRVKERLVGAVILVALIVAFVPEILSGPHKSSGAASTEGDPLRTYTIDLEERGLPTVDSSPMSSAAAPQAAPEPPPPTSETPAASEEPMEVIVAAPKSPAPEPAPVTQARTEPSEPDASNSGWAVQLGSFSNSDNAERLARELRGRGYKAFVSPYESGGQKRLRVRVGPEQDRARAEQLAQRLRREGRQATVVAQP